MTDKTFLISLKIDEGKKHNISTKPKKSFNDVFMNSIFMRFSHKPETTKEPKNAFFFHLVAIIKWMYI